jgi:hypothetical protein
MIKIARLGIEIPKEGPTMIEDARPATRNQWHSYWSEGLPLLGRSENIDDLLKFMAFRSSKTLEFSKWCWATWREA